MSLTKKDESALELIAREGSNLANMAKFQSEKTGKRIKKPPIPPDTLTLAIDYIRELNGISNILIRLTNEIVFPQIKGIVDMAERIRPTLDHMDEWSDEIDDVMATLRINFYGEVTDKKQQQIATKAAYNVNSASEGYFNKLSTKLVGINLTTSEVWLNGEVKGFIKENVALINSISQQHFNRVETIITEGVRRGKLTNEIKTELQSKFKLTKNKAKLIARDQTSKFYGDLSRLRQTHNGIKKYVWQTAQDERVRPDHASKNQRVFSWNNPPADTGHPGEDINCRCSALPVI